MTTPPKDKAQIGLTAEGDARLEKIMAKHLFRTEGECYKFAIAFALSRGLDIEQAPQGGYKTKFAAAGGLDSDGQLRDTLKRVRPDLADRPYWASERLAELGISAMLEHLQSHESVASLLSGHEEETSGTAIT